MKYSLLFLFIILPVAAQHRTGLTFNPEKFKATPKAMLPLKGGDNLPDKIDLSANMPPVGNQGNQGSCVAWSVAYAMKSYQEKIEVEHELSRNGRPDKNNVFSPAYIYNQINHGRDQGSQIWEALNLMMQKGAASWAAMPYNDKDFLRQPSDDIVKDAEKYRITYWRAVNPANITDIKAHLASGFPVIIGAYVDSGFMKLKGAASVYNKISDEKGVGHAMCLVGYDDSKNAFKLINSWSTAWGDGGFGWIDYQFFPKVVREAYISVDDFNGRHSAQPQDKIPELIAGLHKNIGIKKSSGGEIDNLSSNNKKMVSVADSLTGLIAQAVSDNEHFSQAINARDFQMAITAGLEVEGRPAEARIYGKLIIKDAKNLQLSLSISYKGRTFSQTALMSMKDIGFDMGVLDPFSVAPENVQEAATNRKEVEKVRQRIPNRDIKIELFTKDYRRHYMQNELVPLVIKSDVDCHVMVYVRQMDGSEILLFPNEHHRSTALKKGEVLEIPEIEVSSPFGRDMVQVIASSNQKELLQLIDKKAELGSFSELNRGAIAARTRGLRVRKNKTRWGTAVLELNTYRK
ncbi:MAG: DUF4384 domain-containing protein [Lentisphaeraceae bacterium]|nr:DUF4384 domain-containing protein [Lentisphaeraceae bacterium]